MLAGTCLSQWPAICSDRHQARCYPKHRHCDRLGPFPSLASQKLHKASCQHQASSFFSSLRQHPEHQQSKKCRWMGQSPFTGSQGTVMGSTPSCCSLKLRGEDTAWWEQVLQQTQDWQLLKPGDMAGDCLGVVCLTEKPLLVSSLPPIMTNNLV